MRVFFLAGLPSPVGAIVSVSPHEAHATRLQCLAHKIGAVPAVPAVVVVVVLIVIER